MEWCGPPCDVTPPPDIVGRYRLSWLGARPSDVARSVVGARILEWCADRGTVAEIDHPIDSARGTVFYVENVKRNADGRLRRILNAAWPPVVAVGGPRVSAACAVTRTRR